MKTLDTWTFVRRVKRALDYKSTLRPLPNLVRDLLAEEHFEDVALAAILRQLALVARALNLRPQVYTALMRIADRIEDDRVGLESDESGFVDPEKYHFTPPRAAGNR
jgi:hypothetical protein